MLSLCVHVCVCLLFYIFVFGHFNVIVCDLFSQIHSSGPFCKPFLSFITYFFWGLFPAFRKVFYSFFGYLVSFFPQLLCRSVEWPGVIWDLCTTIAVCYFFLSFYILAWSLPPTDARLWLHRLNYRFLFLPAFHSLLFPSNSLLACLLRTTSTFPPNISVLFSFLSRSGHIVHLHTFLHAKEHGGQHYHWTWLFWNSHVRIKLNESSFAPLFAKLYQLPVNMTWIF